MRSLAPATDAVIDPETREIRDGSYRGPLPRIDLEPLGKPALFRLTHHKKWVYTAIASPDVFVACAVVDLGYVINAFAFALETSRSDKALSAHTSFVAPPFAGSVSDTSGEGCRARFQFGKTSISFDR